MSATRSPTTGRHYPLTQVCAVYRVPRSTAYTAAARTTAAPESSGAIRAVLAATPFHGEGHRKVRARLRQQGHRVGRHRVLRLMRLHGLLAPQRAGHRHGDPADAGTITPAWEWQAEKGPFGHLKRDCTFLNDFARVISRSRAGRREPPRGTCVSST